MIQISYFLPISTIFFKKSNVTVCVVGFEGKLIIIIFGFLEEFIMFSSTSIKKSSRFSLSDIDCRFAPAITTP